MSNLIFKITKEERDVFSKAGWKNYRQFIEGEISFDELKNPNHTQKENITVDKNEQASKTTDIEQKLQDVSPTSSVDENGQGNLFDFICAETSLNNDATYKVDKYRGNPLDPSITRDGINEAKAARAKHTKEVLTGEQKCLWKCFKDFKTHNVFDIQGKKIEFDKDGKMSETSWKQLKAAMDIYRDKRFESFRYLLIDKETGQVRDQLALAVKMPHISFADAPDKSTTKKVLERAEKNNCFIVAVHNHPSGDIEPSPQDIATTKILENAFTPEGGTESLLKGHIILDHDTFSLYTKETGWTKCDSEKQLGYDPIGNELPEWAKVTNGGISNDVDLLKIAESINDYYEWHKDYVPFIFTSNPTIMAVQYYHKDFVGSYEPVNGKMPIYQVMDDARDMGATNIFPIMTDDLLQKMERIVEITEDGETYTDNPAREMIERFFIDHSNNIIEAASPITDGVIGKQTLVDCLKEPGPGKDIFYDDRKSGNISIKETSTWNGEIEHKTNDKSNRKEIER